jgi:hypothetical protein
VRARSASSHRPPLALQRRDLHWAPPTVPADQAEGDDGGEDEEKWDDGGNARGAAAVAAFKVGIKNAERSFAVLYARCLNLK